MIARLVLFGASGDLTSRLLLPAIAQLAEAELPPPGLTVVGSDITDWSTNDFRQHIAGKLEEHAAVTPATRDAVVSMLSFEPADVTRPEDVSRLIGDDHPDTLVYLALPPSLLTKMLPALAATTLGAPDAVAIEKPFGTDLASAHHLNEILRIQLPEPTIFRIDHFLSSELVRRVLVLRFLNRVFEPILNTVHVDRVDISWLESLTLEGRASYYDGAGALKDMVQNHLMEAMALVLMEQPARIDADSFRSVRVEALRAVATPTVERMRSDTIRARYTAGTIGSRQVPAYVDEPGVDPQPQRRDVRVPDGRSEQPPVGWSPVHPALGQSPRVRFRRARHPLPHPGPLSAGPVARRRAQRAQDRSHRAVRAPGHDAQRSRANRREPRTRGTLDRAAIHGPCPPDPRDAQERPDAVHPRRRGRGAWRIIDPVMKAWSAEDVPIQQYAAGQAPPGPPL
jgi:glucose-6-phosphate 1-dehydrogenase